MSKPFKTPAQDLIDTGQTDLGPEPERYYDWMLWKLRQEEHQVQEMTTEEMYKLEIAEMQKTNHNLQTRVKELNDAVLQLQEQKDR